MAILADLFVLSIICSLALLNLPDKFNLILLGLAIVILLKQNAIALAVAYCLSGAYFTNYLKHLHDFSSTTYITLPLTLFLLFILIFKKQLNFQLAKRKSYRQLFLLMGMTFFYLFLCYLNSTPSFYNKFYIQFFFIYTIFACLAGLLVINYNLHIKDIIIPITLFIACIFPLTDSTLANVDQSILYSPIGLRAAEEIGGINTGRVAGLLFLLAFCCLCVTNSVKYDKLLIIKCTVATIVSIWLLWFFQTRQAMFGSFLIIEAYLLFFRVKKNHFKGKSLLYGIIVGTFVAMISVTLVSFLSTHSHQKRLYYLFDEPTSQIGGRIENYTTALKEVIDKPIIGNGMGVYYHEYGKYVHNWPLESWHSFGIVGFILLSIPLYFVIKAAVSKPSEHYFPWCLLGLYWLLMIQVSGDIASNFLIYFFFTILFIRSREH